MKRTKKTKRMLLRDQKRLIFDPIFSRVRRSRGNEVNVLPYYDPKKMTHLWKTRGYFAQDIRQFMPPDMALRSAQRCGTFLKTDELLVVLGRGKTKKTFFGKKHQKLTKKTLATYNEIPTTEWPNEFISMDTIMLLKKEEEGAVFYAQIMSNDEVFVYKSVQV